MTKNDLKSGRKIEILGVKVADLSFEEAVERILALAADKGGGHYVVTVNPEFVMLARRNWAFLEILNEADLAVADGMGVVIAKLIFGGKFHDRITGVDLIEELCAKAAKRAIRVGFLGGFGSVAKIVAKRQKAKNPGLSVVIAEPGDLAIGQDLRLNQDLSAALRVDILFVAYGMGQQEFWIKRHLNKLNKVDVAVFVGVGGAFDYLSTVKKRAPLFLQKGGLEWFWRLLWEPSRFWRMRVLPLFFVLILLKFFRSK